MASAPSGTEQWPGVKGSHQVTGGGRSYTWRADNLPSSITGPDGVTETYGYDADGERLTKTRNGVTTVYLNRLWEEVIGGGRLSYYTFGGMVIAQRSGPSYTVPTYLFGDHLGSVSVAVNNNSGQVTTQEYDPWGKVLSSTMSGVTLNYTGQRLDSTGLLYYHARYYDPSLGRFTSADPRMFDSFNPQARNRYSYVLNNPLKNIDPSGNIACKVDEDTGINVCQKQADKLQGFGIDIDDLEDWDSDELDQVLNSVGAYLYSFGWNAEDFKSAMTNNGQYRVILYRAHNGPPGWVNPPDNGIITIYLADTSFTGNLLENARYIVHEFAHVWDFASQANPNKGLRVREHGYYAPYYDSNYDQFKILYYTDDEVSQYPRSNNGGGGQVEDWAETVTAVVLGPDEDHQLSDTRLDYVCAWANSVGGNGGTKCGP